MLHPAPISTVNIPTRGEALTVDKVIKPCSHQCEKGICSAFL